MRFKNICLSLLSVLLICLFTPEAYGRGFAFQREFEPVEPFEKIYVSQDEILCTPFGIFLKHPNGHNEKVRSLLNDFKGTYVLRVKTQCPLCGRCYYGQHPDEGYSCPLYDKEIFPGIWGAP